MLLNEKEKNALGKRVKFTKDVEFGGLVGTVPKGITGFICDFGYFSGDPIIQLEDDKKVNVPWDAIEFTQGCS